MKHFFLLIGIACLASCYGPSANDKTRVAVLPDGRKVNIYHLQNSQGVSVEISELGATILSIRTPDRKNHFDDIMPGYDSIADYVNDRSYFCGVVGRYANRIADGKFTIDSATYNLEKNENGINHIHGGLNGFNKKIWKGEMVSVKDIHSVMLRYTSADGEEGYPGKLTIQVVYFLTDSNELNILYSAKTDKPTVVNLTNHSYFNLSGNCDSSILNHVLQINADSYLPVNKALIPLGEPSAVENTPFDFRSPKNIGKDLAATDSQFVYCNGGYDHNFILNRKDSKVAFACRLSDPANGRVLEIYTNQPGLQFYSGNFFNGSVKGKGGCLYKKYGALVFEAQKFPDSPNHPSYPSTVLKPGEEYSQHTVFKFSVQ